MVRKLRVGLGMVCLSGMLFFSAPLAVDAKEAGVRISNANFPDAMFREYVKEFDKDGNGTLSTQELDAVTRIDVGRTNVSSLKGIGYFTKLKGLDARSCKLTSLDLSKNTALEGLDVRGNKLMKLDLKNNTALEDLNCSNNALTYLNVSGCKSLSVVKAVSNKLTELDIRNCTKLELLWVDDNSIKNLDISTNGKLISAFVGGNTEKGGQTYRTPEGVNALMADSGAGIFAGRNRWFHNGNQWYYLNAEGAVTRGWKKVDGYWYFFKSTGIMASREYIDGYWIDKNGTCTYKYRASWKHDSKGWWYGDPSGWYAKSMTLTIDGKKYSFDSKGYLK